jgi:hypothetical protein
MKPSVMEAFVLAHRKKEPRLIAGVLMMKGVWFMNTGIYHK